jgi:hypothetical protein
MEQINITACVNLEKFMFSIFLTLAIRNFCKKEKRKKSMHVRVMIFQRGILRKIHCCCIEGGIYNLKKVYSLY